MAYEVTPYYLDVSYYEKNPTVPNLDRLRRDKVNKAIEILGMTGGDWTTEKKTWTESGVQYSMDVATGRYATIEGYPFMFYVEAGRFSSGYGWDYMARIFLVNPETKTHITTNFNLINAYDISPVPQNFKGYHYAGMIEKIKDVGGGLHLHIIQKKYDNDNSYSYDGNRLYFIDIVPVYDTETNNLVDWAIHCQYGWYLSKDMSKSVSLDFTNSSSYIKIYNSGETSTDYPTLTDTQAIYSTVGAYNKYYTVGFCGNCKGLTVDTANYSNSFNNRVNIKDKIVLPKTKDDNDLYFIRGYNVIAYIEEEEVT